MPAASHRSPPPLALDQLPPLLSPHQVLELTGVSLVTLNTWINQGRFPRPQYLSRRLRRFVRDEVLVFLGLAQPVAKNRIKERAHASG